MTRGFSVDQKNDDQRPKKTRYIPIAVKQELFKRAQGSCEFIGRDGVRGQSRYKLQIDYFEVPFSQGGANSIDNCKLLCSSHNLHRASLAGIGIEMTSKIPSSSTRSSLRWIN